MSPGFRHSGAGTTLVSLYGVWHHEARELPNEDLPGPREVAIIKHFLGCVRFDAWHPPFKPGWVSVGVPPDLGIPGQAPDLAPD